MVGDGELRMGVNMSAKSSFYHNARNFDADKLPGYAVFDTDLTYEFNSGLSIGGFIKNIFDKRYASVGLDLSGACGCNLEAYGQPMTWGIKASQEF